MIKIDWPSRGHLYLEEEIQAVVNIMRDSECGLTQGKFVKKFESDFIDYIGHKNCFTTMSGAHALDISAMLFGFGEEDEVIIPAHTYCATAIAFGRRRCKIKWADIDENSFSVSLKSIQSLCTENTKAIVVVHIYGLICPEIKEICQFAKERGIMVIEDCAQSLGAKLDGQHGGTFGDIACYSFHSQKNITTLGEGGMILVKDDHLASKVPGLRLNGHAPYRNQESYWLPAMTNVESDINFLWPMKSTLTEAQAAVGSLLLNRLDQLTLKRRERGVYIREKFSESKSLKFQGLYSDFSHSHHLLPALCSSSFWTRDDLIRKMYNEYQIKCIVQYQPLNRYGLFIKNGYGDACIPNTDNFFDNMISFPFSLQLSDEQFFYICNSLASAVQELEAR